MRRSSNIRLVILGLVLFAGPLAQLACITVVEQPAGGGTAVAGTNDNSAPANDNTSANDNTGGTVGNGNDNSGGGADGNCEDTDRLQVTYVNEAPVRVVFVENHRDQNNVAIAAGIRALQPAGASGSTRVDCLVCPYTAGVRNISYFDTSPSSDGIPPSDMRRGTFRCGGAITITFRADKTATITVDN